MGSPTPQTRSRCASHVCRAKRVVYGAVRTVNMKPKRETRGQRTALPPDAPAESASKDVLEQRRGGEGGAATQKCVYQKWPK